MNQVLSRVNKFVLCWVVFLCLTQLVTPATAQTYISAEPIPSGDIVGSANLDKILGLGYSKLERWSDLLLNQCRITDDVIHSLSVNGAIHTINSNNTDAAVAAGGFEGVTDPTYVLKVNDSGSQGASATDIGILDNALGYVLNQGGTVHFSPSNFKAYDFPLDYAVVSFNGNLSGTGAKGFFEYLGTIDPALFSGMFAGFTQIDNSMLFLQPATSKNEFISGLSTAAGNVGAQYSPTNKNGVPTTARAGVSFPGNDWVTYPNGDQYLVNITNATPALLNELAALRQKHLRAVSDLLNAINKGTVQTFLNQFKCPR